MLKLIPAANSLVNFAKVLLDSTDAREKGSVRETLKPEFSKLLRTMRETEVAIREHDSEFRLEGMQTAGAFVRLLESQKTPDLP